MQWSSWWGNSNIWTWEGICSCLRVSGRSKHVRILPVEMRTFTIEHQPYEVAKSNAVWLSCVTAFTTAPLATRACNIHSKCKPWGYLYGNGFQILYSTWFSGDPTCTTLKNPASAAFINGVQPDFSGISTAAPLLKRTCKMQASFGTITLDIFTTGLLDMSACVSNVDLCDLPMAHTRFGCSQFICVIKATQKISYIRLPQQQDGGPALKQHGVLSAPSCTEHRHELLKHTLVTIKKILDHFKAHQL